jgi:hypothetical protein
MPHLSNQTLTANSETAIPIPAETLRVETQPADPICHRIKLICKLRWIGMEEEAAELMRTLPYDRRVTPITDSSGTD